MQEKRIALPSRRAIAAVAYYRVSDVAKMSPDLMSSAGVQCQLQQGPIAAGCEDFVISSSGFAAIINKNLRLVHTCGFSQQ